MKLKRTCRCRAFTLVDTLIAFLILAVGGLSLSTALPTLSRSHAIADETSKAVQLASRQLEQLRLVRFENITYETLRDLDLIETWSGEGPYTFTNLSTDTATNFSPARALNQGEGRIYIEEIDSNVKTIRVEVVWLAASGQRRSVSVETAVGRY